jgi:hypothetical protein
LPVRRLPLFLLLVFVSSIMMETEVFSLVLGEAGLLKSSTNFFRWGTIYNQLA